jgi:hypothetical protein
MPKTEGEHTFTFYERVDAVVLVLFENPAWILPKRCHDLSEIVQKKFKVSNVQASTYIKEAKKIFRKYQEKDLEEKRIKAILDREKVIRLALKDGKLQTALNAMKERDIIQGIYIEKHEHIGKMNVNFGAIPVSPKAIELSQQLYTEINGNARKN